jgi:hypothetical protein
MYANACELTLKYPTTVEAPPPSGETLRMHVSEGRISSNFGIIIFFDETTV